MCLRFCLKSTLKSAQTASAAGASTSPLYTALSSWPSVAATRVVAAAAPTTLVAVRAMSAMLEMMLKISSRDDHSRNDVGVDGTHSGDIGVVALEHEAHDEAEAHSQSRFCLSTHSLSHDVPPI